MRDFPCINRANSFCFGFWSTRAIGRQQHNSWGGLRGTVQSRAAGWRLSSFWKWKNLWKDTCGASRNASFLPSITAVAGIGGSPVYLELEDRKLVKGLESRGWCGTEFRDGLTPLVLGTYSLHLIKILSCCVLALLSDFGVSVGPVGAIVGCKHFKHHSANVWPISRRKMSWLTSLENFFLLICNNEIVETRSGAIYSHLTAPCSFWPGQ